MGSRDIRARDWGVRLRLRLRLSYRTRMNWIKADFMNENFSVNPEYP